MGRLRHFEMKCFGVLDHQYNIIWVVYSLCCFVSLNGPAVMHENGKMSFCWFLMHGLYSERAFTVVSAHSGSHLQMGGGWPLHQWMKWTHVFCEHHKGGLLFQAIHHLQQSCVDLVTVFAMKRCTDVSQTIFVSDCCSRCWMNLQDLFRSLILV